MLILLFLIQGCQADSTRRFILTGHLNSLASRFDLEQVNDVLEGTFHYLKNPKEKIRISGKINGTEVELFEYNGEDQEVTGVFYGEIIANRFKGYWTSPGGNEKIVFSYEMQANDYSSNLESPDNTLDRYKVEQIVLSELRNIDFCDLMWRWEELSCSPVHEVLIIEEFDLNIGERIYVLAITKPEANYDCNACLPSISVFVLKESFGELVIESKDINTVIEGYRGTYDFGTFEKIGRNTVGIIEEKIIFYRGINFGRSIYGILEGKVSVLVSEWCDVDVETEAAVGANEPQNQNRNGCICCFRMVEDETNFFDAKAIENKIVDDIWVEKATNMGFINGKFIRKD